MTVLTTNLPSIELRYDATCRICRTPLAAGRHGHYDRSRCAVYCPECYEKATAQFLGEDVMAAEVRDPKHYDADEGPYHRGARGTVTLKRPCLTPEDRIVLGREVRLFTTVRPWLGCCWHGDLLSVAEDGRTAVIRWAYPMGD